MNKVVLIGRLTRDPELKQLPTGNNVCNFSLAVDRPFRNKEGQYEADFLNIIVFGRSADNVKKYCGKGSQVAVEGRIQVRNYDAQDGTKRYITEIVADRVEFCGGKRETFNDNSNDMAFASATPVNNVPFGPELDMSDSNQFNDFGSDVSISDDDLPF